MGIEKREGDDKLPDGIVMNEETIVRGPEAPTVDIVSGDEVIKSAEEIAGEMNSENPDGPEYAPVGTIPEPPDTVEGGAQDATNNESGVDASEDGDDVKRTERGTPEGRPV